MKPELILEAELVEDGSWYEAATSAYVQADQKIAEGKWERARVAFYIVGRAYKHGESGLVEKFAGDVRRSGSHVRHEAFAFSLQVLLQGVGQPTPLTLTPTFYVEAAKGRRGRIEAGDENAIREAGELLERAEDEHWTASTLRRKAAERPIKETGEAEDVERFKRYEVVEITRLVRVDIKATAKFSDESTHDLDRATLLEHGWKPEINITWRKVKSRHGSSPEDLGEE